METPKLHLFNSLSRKKELFIPRNGNKVLWYSCGPTVYDHSHMGHARSYVTFDIILRILRDYFQFDVVYCMNITDIDDKIIKRARQEYLFSDYIAATKELAVVLSDIEKAIGPLKDRVLKEDNNDKKCFLQRQLEGVLKARDSFVACCGDGESEGLKIKELITEAKFVLSDWLDAEKGASVTENSIFSQLPQHFEKEYFADMALLNVKSPDVLTRVSEYVPEIVDYVQTIIGNGFAYESGQSVYFDVAKFSNDPDHRYAKMVPEAVGDVKVLQEGEGDLFVGKLQEKRSPNDFALWKKSKRGEPAWESPWGKGRPGWHIECSVMASCILGDHIDIHSGGVDLKFPHHDNELAQAEAYFGNDEWIKYFIHSGHLHIEGCKMSKSLKNFITIKDALLRHSSRQLRLAFLLHSWKDTLDYSENTMQAALQYEKTLQDFFLSVKDLVRKQPPFVKWGPRELQFNDSFHFSKDSLHRTLCDSIDTKGAMNVLKQLVSDSNVYLNSASSPNARLLQDVSCYIIRMLRIFGAVTDNDDLVGFPGNAAPGDLVNKEEVILPFVTTLAEFRDDVRKSVRNDSGKDSVLEICDRLRDVKLPLLGVRLEDKGGDTVVKLVDPDVLKREQEELEAARLRKQDERSEAKRKADDAKSARDAKKKMNPADMFMNDKGKYSKFDDRGIPSHDSHGEPLSNSQVKKLSKLYKQQEKLYEEFLSTL